MKLVLEKTLWVFLFFTLTIVEFSFCIGICRENEQQALETLKKEVYDPKDRLLTWVVGKDCCEWNGVVCHNLTRHVTELYIYGGEYLRISNLEWLPSLVNLNHLSMDSVDLSKSTNWLHITNILPSLVHLTLRNCSLERIPPLLDHRNFSSLETLELSWNKFSSPVPKWIFSLHTLVSLNLSSSIFTAPFPEGPINLTSLTTFDASRNSFNCLLPRWLSDLHNLETLDVSGNRLSGKIFNIIGRLRKLEYLDFSSNLFEGEISETCFTNMIQLRYLLASENNLTLKVSETWIPPFQAEGIVIGGWNLGPQFPMWLQTQKKIVYLDISNGGIKGEVPLWVWNISSQLKILKISHNQFVGEVPNISATVMSFSSNNFSGPLPQISTAVTLLDLSNNSFSGGLFDFLCHEVKNKSYQLEFLNLGENDFFGEIPDCWMNWPKLEVLILRGNYLIGGLPRSIEALSGLKSLDLRGNRLTGPFPSSLGNCTNLIKMDLAENEFVGLLPPWLGIRLSHLIILILRSNKFHGQLPSELCFLKDLQILDLANNTFCGVIPRCIGNITAMATKSMETEVKNEFYYLIYFTVLHVRASEMVATMRESALLTTKGNVYWYDTILALVTSMDMSNNNLSGDIPTSLTNLVRLRFCNFSKNHLAGGIPNGIGNMKVLESFDLSENQLSGKIPQSLASLSSLAYLNISFNNLSGKIPLSTQLQSFSPSSFQGNKLCGLPLLLNCTSGGPFPKLDENEEEESNDDNWDGFYISMAIGFGLSFWGLGASLIFKRSWRHAYYRILDTSWNYLREKLHI